MSTSPFQEANDSTVLSSGAAVEESPSSPSSQANQCTNCKKPESDPEQPLKQCIKCHSVQYCDRDCQKADFKLHKKACAKLAQIYAQNANVKMATPSRPPRDGHRGGLQKWQFDT